MEKNIEIDLTSVGKRIRKARKEQDLTLEEAAGLADFSQQHLSIVERGLRRGSIIAYVKIAAALGLSLDDLFYPNKKGVQTGKDFTLEELLADCSAFERTIIRDVLFSLKAALVNARKL